MSSMAMHPSAMGQLYRIAAQVATADETRSDTALRAPAHRVDSSSGFLPRWFCDHTPFNRSSIFDPVGSVFGIGHSLLKKDSRAGGSCIFNSAALINWLCPILLTSETDVARSRLYRSQSLQVNTQLTLQHFSKSTRLSVYHS